MSASAAPSTPSTSSTLSAGSKRARESESETESALPADPRADSRADPEAGSRAATRVPWHLVGKLAERCRSDAGLSEAARAAAASAGVPESADAWLCHLGRAVGAALSELPAHAEGASERLRAVRAALHAAVDARCDVLEDTVRAAKADKAAALERELCAIDGALEAVRASRDAAAAQVRAWTVLGEEGDESGGAMAARTAELTAQLDAAEAQLAALPTCVVESPKIKASFKLEATLAGIASWGHVTAPRAISVADLTLEVVSNAHQRAWAGHALWLKLRAPALPDSDDSFEALKAVAATTRVQARLESGADVPASVGAFKSTGASTSCVYIKINVPADGGTLSWAVSVAGRPVALPDALRRPWRIELPYDSKLPTAVVEWLQRAISPSESAAATKWQEVYRATRDGFDAAALAACRSKRRLLVLVEDQEGRTFGGFTAVGVPNTEGVRVYDSDAFSFSIDKKKTTAHGTTVCCENGFPLCMGTLRIGADKTVREPLGMRVGARAAEIVAWTV